MSKRVMGYIDGFNLHCGTREAGWGGLLWLDICTFLERLVKPGHVLIGAKYFTSRLSGPGEQWRQQALFLKANERAGRCSLFYGYFQNKTRHCGRCGAENLAHSEKTTDVNIAMEVLVDAFQDRFDTALLVSADSDLAPVIAKVRALFPQKRVVVAFPPRRRSKRLKELAHGYFYVNRRHLLESQLPATETAAEMLEVGALAADS